MMESQLEVCCAFTACVSPCDLAQGASVLVLQAECHGSLLKDSPPVLRQEWSMHISVNTCLQVQPQLLPRRRPHALAYVSHRVCALIEP